MKRVRILPLAAAALVIACQSDVPTEPGGISAAISDGAHTADGGPNNSHVFFLPPMVPDPGITETFNPTLRPEVLICEFDEGDQGKPNDEVCDFDEVVNRVFGSFDANRVPDKENYLFSWKTDDEEFGAVGGLLLDKFYRLLVSVDVAGEETLVAYADVDVEATEEDLRLAEEAHEKAGEDFVMLKLDRTLPVKFFVGLGMFCEIRGITDPALCGEGFSDFGDEFDDVITLGDDGIEIPVQTVQVGAITLIITPCVDLLIDNPRFGPCIDIETFPEVTEPLDPPAVVFFCEVLPVGALDDFKDADVTDPSQKDFITIIRRDNDAVPDETFEALPHAGENCGRLTASSGDLSRFFQFARSGLNAVRDAVSWALAPKPLEAAAMRRRRGNLSETGFTSGFSQFQFALPALMSAVDATNGQTGPANGPPITIEVEFNDPAPLAVAGARVECGVTSGLGGSVVPVLPATPVLRGEDAGKNISDGNGIAAFEWFLGNPGDQEVRCTAFGIAGDGDAGPFTPPIFDENGVPLTIAVLRAQDPVPLDIGTVTFTAFACNNFVIDANGSIDEDEWATASEHTFTANLAKGNKAPATVRVMNDCDNLYIALSVERPEADDVNVLRVDFDNNGDGAPAEGDDLWKLEAVAGADPVVTDGFLTSRCFRGGKQAECFTDDTEAGGSNDVDAGHGFGGGLSVYEFKHSLSTGDTRSSDGLSIDVDLVRDGSTFGMFFTLSQSPSAKGAQGNTQWPGFRLYLQCTTVTPTTSGSALTCEVAAEQ